jgi:hypothetical protein
MSYRTRDMHANHYTTTDAATLFSNEIKTDKTTDNNS